MSDIVERLRSVHNDTWPMQIGHGDLINPDGPEAAGEIERLRAALTEIVALNQSPTSIGIARAALEGQGGGS